MGRGSFGKALVLVSGMIAVTGSTHAQTQADQTQRNLTPPNQPPSPPPPPTTPPPNRSGELGGVKMRLPDPLSNRGSLLEQRLRPMPKLWTPTLPPQGPNWVPDNSGPVLRYRPDGRYGDGRTISNRGGVTIDINPDGTRQIRVIPRSVDNAYWYGDGAFWKYPHGWNVWYRSDWRYGCRPLNEPVGDASQKPDRFVQFDMSSGGVDYLDPKASLSEIDRAELAMKAGDWKSAVQMYRDHLGLAPSDAATLRVLGLALVLDGNVSEGVTSIALAYQRDASLGRKAMDLRVMRSETDVAQAATAIMNFAARVKTVDAMLAGAVVKQATGAKSVALRMLDRAQVAGLSSSVESELRAGILAMK